MAGNVGLPLTAFVELLATSVTAIMALGTSAAATNMRIGVGGKHSTVQRGLGLELHIPIMVVVGCPGSRRRASARDGGQLPLAGLDVPRRERRQWPPRG